MPTIDITSPGVNKEPLRVAITDIITSNTSNYIVQQVNSFTYSTSIHKNKLVLATSANTSNITLPASAGIGESVNVVQFSTGAYTFIAGANTAILKASPSATINGQNAVAAATVIQKTGGTTSWLVYGNLA